MYLGHQCCFAYYIVHRRVDTCTPLCTDVHIIIKRVSALDKLTSGNRSECTILHVEMKMFLGRGMPPSPSRLHIVVRRTR